LITRLRLCAYAQIVMTIVVLALWAAVLAASPAAASAKATPLTKDLQDTDSAAGVAKRVVVAPGDSLWSISAQWLGPEASTHQIADGVKRIYALNEERIGNDTNLIFAGQSLLLPKQLERQAPEPGSAAPAGRALGEADHKEGQARNEARSEPASLPGPARPVPVAAVGLLAPHDLPPSLAKPGTPNTRSVSFSAVVGTVGEAFSLGAYSERKVLGGALLAMSSVLALVLALRVAREALGPSYARRKARERWTREALSPTAPSTLAMRLLQPSKGVIPRRTAHRRPRHKAVEAGGLRTRAPSGHRNPGAPCWILPGISPDVGRSGCAGPGRSRQNVPPEAT
jgi:hypothetical protein